MKKLRRRRGQGAVEYVVITALLALLLVTALDRYGLSLKKVFGATTSRFASAKRLTMVRTPRRALAPGSVPARGPRPGSRTPAPTTGTMPVSWSPTPGAVGYRVYYGTQPGSYSGSLDMGSSPAYVVGGLEPGRRYYFAISSYDAAGNESAPGREIPRDVAP